MGCSQRLLELLVSRCKAGLVDTTVSLVRYHWFAMMGRYCG